MISVIIPCYNSAHMVSHTLDSVLNSTHKDCEIILVNDGSNDNLSVVISRYLENNRIKYIEQENKGLPGARNTGIRNAKGQYLVFLDADDIIGPEKLSIQKKYLDENPSIDIVYSNSEWFIEDDINNTHKVNFPVYTQDILGKLIYGNFIHVNSVMVRKEAVEKAGLFDENLRELEDWDLWLRLALGGSKFGFTPGVHSKVRIRKGSMTSNQKKMNETMIKVLEKTINQIHTINPKNKSTLLSAAYRAIAIYKLQANQRSGYLRFLCRTFYQQGIGFAPTLFKQAIKYSFPFLQKNKTTSDIEKVWNR